MGGWPAVVAQRGDRGGEGVTPTADEATLLVHIAFGFVALGAGAVAILTRKGGQRHRRAGRAYVYAMTGVAATALALYPLEPSPTRLFLALVAVFSYYFVFSGYRVLGRKRPTAEPAMPDWVAVGLVLLAGGGLIAYGGLMATRGAQFAPILLVFGGIGTLFGAADLRAFRRPDAVDRHWSMTHLTRMGGGYIATVTAFTSVNFLFLPTLARWLAPTAIGTAAILYGQRRYRERFVPAARGAD